MSKLPSTVEAKAAAATLLAAGRTQVATATEVGVARSTLNRWLNDPDFKSSITDEKKRREDRFAAELKATADQAQDVAINSIKADLEEFYKQLRQAQKIRVQSGLALITKSMKRFKDLPEEAIAIKDVAALAMAGDKLLEKGFEMWADSLAIAELQEALLGDKSQP